VTRAGGCSNECRNDASAVHSHGRLVGTQSRDSPFAGSTTACLSGELPCHLLKPERRPGARGGFIRSPTDWSKHPWLPIRIRVTPLPDRVRQPADGFHSLWTRHGFRRPIRRPLWDRTVLPTVTCGTGPPGWPGSWQESASIPTRTMTVAESLETAADHHLEGARACRRAQRDRTREQRQWRHHRIDSRPCSVIALCDH
jgi:hypothetical protein